MDDTMRRRAPQVLPLALLLACSSGDPDAGDAPSAQADTADVSADAPQDEGSSTPDATAGGDAADALDDPAPSDGSGLDTRPPDVADIDPSELGGADGSAEPDAEIVVPERGRVHELRAHDAPVYTDDTYLSEETTYYRTPAGISDVDVRAIRVVEGVVVAGTASGVAIWSPERDVFEAAPDGPADAVVDIADAAIEVAGRRFALVASAETAWLVDLETRATAQVVTAPERGLVAVATDGTRAFGATGGGIYELAAGEWSVAPIWATDGSISDLALTDAFQVATDGGLVVVGTDGAPIATRLPGVPITAVTDCPLGRLIVGTETGAAAVSRDGFVVPDDAGPRRLARGAVHDLDCGEIGYAVAHDLGASFVTDVDGRHDHYVSPRWVLDDRVAGVATGAAGVRWVATAAGVTRIDLVPRTLAEKAAARQDDLDRYFWRAGGFVGAEYDMPDPWTIEGGAVHDKDNDGLWTQMMIGAWAFASAVTGDAAYCDDARRAIRNMLWLVDIPCETFSAAGLDCGFIARSFVRDDEGSVYESKLTQPNWHQVAWTDGHTYLWKDDTSSDEVAGHAFGFPLFYDLCATGEERAEIAERFGALTRYIIDGGYQLIDLDGARTTHGLWDPLNVASCADGVAQCRAGLEICASACFGGGYLNSMEILGTLLAAWHMTGDELFYREYERLIREHGYDRVALSVDDALTLHNPQIENHSDHELMMLAYHTLIRYEPNDDRRAAWSDALGRMYETERNERNPLWVAWVAGLSGAVLDQSDAVRTLREFPWDQRTWTVDNSHRADHFVNTARDRFGAPQFYTVPPYDEIEAWWWNGNPLRVVQGGSGREIQGPMAYLLAYWSMRYYGLLE